MTVELESGTLLAGSYRIERELGRGGMAAVYVAEDRKHHRKVAVKVLRPELAANLGAERFQREIETAARLTHPHILTIHDSGEAGGLLFYVMPYVEGESLRQRLDREGELPVGDAVRIARHVADALAYAHAREVIHRDVKPENILLEGRHAVLADFGIARAVGAAGGDRLTKAGLAVGTPAYMSPEQGAGEESVDGRADAYALGCVLHEMLAGRPPLTGRTARATLARRLTESPPALRHLRETVPPELERAVQRAIARSPADRFPTAERFARTLEAVEAGIDVPAASVRMRQGSRAPRRLLAGLSQLRGRPALAAATTLILAAGVIGLLLLSPFRGEGGDARSSRGIAAADMPATRIAVLPFDDLSSDGRLSHISAGFTRSLIQELTAVEALDVISYNGVKGYRAAGASFDSAGRDLRAGTLVGAAVDESDGQLRVQVDLIDGESGSNLASTRLERPRTDPFALQHDITREVAHFLRQQLGTAVALRGRRAATESVQAWELVQRAEELRESYRPLWRAGARDAVLRTLADADTLLARAEELDSRWAEPIVLRGRLAEIRARLISDTPGRYDEENARSALSHAERALGVDPESAAALELRGTVLFNLWRDAEVSERSTDSLDEAERDLRAAVTAEPSRAGAWSTLSLLLQTGRASFAEARLAALRAYEEDAFLTDAADILLRLANLAGELGRYEEAMRWAREGRERFPEVVDFAAAELMILASVGDNLDSVRRAWALHGEIGDLSPRRWRQPYLTGASMQVAAVLARAGLADSARTVIHRTLAEAPEDVRRWASYEEAHARLLIGERDEALRALGTFLEDNPDMKAYLAEDPWFEPLRDDPRFRNLTATTR